MLFLSCLDEPVQQQHGKAMVSFSVTDARTVLPQASLADVASYTLLGGRNSEAETVLVESFTGTGTSLFLVYGTWNFTLNAYNSAGGHILQGRVTNRLIYSAETNRVSFSLSPVNSGTGAIQITLNFPESAGITRIVVKSGTGSENFTPANSGSFVYSKDGVAAGDHLISFELYRLDMLQAVVSELVLVRSNLTSSKTVILVEDNLKPLLAVGIEIGLTGLDEWEMIEQIVQTSDNADKVFTINGTYTTYRWYLDGTQVGTSSSYTFNKPVGVYQLVVVATNSAGESRSGRCRITVAPSLTANVWADGNITDADGEDWYSFPVIANTTYRIWWNDRKEGDETQSGDVAVSARYENETAFFFGGIDTTVDSGWTTAQSFTASQTGTVYIRVIPYDRSNSNTGTYSIAYNTGIYRPAIYTVTFNINDGIGTTPSARTVISGSSITLPDGSGFSRGGYAFGGWNTLANGTGTNYNANASYTPTGDITLYARWNAVYTVTFNINGGSGTTPAAQTVTPGSYTTLPNGSGFSRSGYTFMSWSTEASGITGYSPGSSYRPTGDITLYATWVANYTVTFSANGGTGTPPAAMTVNVGSSITLPDASGLSRDGYIFAWWNTEASGNGTNYAPGSSYTPTYSATLYAKWNYTGETYFVYFVANGGSGTAPAGQTVNPGSSIILPDRYTLSKSGYTFGGWNTMPNGSGTNYAVGSSYTPTGNVILNALWIPNNPITLTANVWRYSYIEETSEDWHSFPVTSGTTYYIWSSDLYYGSGSQTGVITMRAQYSNGTSIFSSVSRWTTPQSFTANQTGTVYLGVFHSLHNPVGTYGIVYSTGTTRP
jgi:uncharacterized repeat protein (TIGR02543 family)